MKRVAIVGAGALGRQIIDLLDAERLHAGVVYFDDTLAEQGAASSFAFASALDERFADCEFYIGLGYKHLPLKADLVRRLLEATRRLPPLVHPSAVVHSSARLRDGSVIYPLCNVGANTEIGTGVLLNNSVVVSHDCRIGSCAYLSPGVVLSGQVTVGEAAFLGAGTLVADHRTIGRHARIGIGSVVTRDVGDAASAIGNPLRDLQRPLHLV